MQTTLPETFKYEKRYWYPHMGPRDADLWNKFIEKYPDMFDRCVYDLAIGDDPSVDEETRSDLREMWQYQCSYKCDVVAFKGEKPTIIEIKPRAGLPSVGQIVCYDLLYQEYVDKNARPDLVIITDSLRSDMDWLADEFGVKIMIV